MRFKELLRLLWDEQDLHVVYDDGFAVNGSKDSLQCMMADRINNASVYRIEPDGKVLNVWVKSNDIP